MRTLVIDTASEVCSVALFDGAHCLAHCTEIIGRGHAERLVPMVAALPGGGRAEHILVGCGPGSFTGVRVAIASARGLGIGWGASVDGFGSLALVAAGVGAGEDRASEDRASQPLLVVMDGGHGQYLVQPFAVDGAPLADPRAVDPAAAVADATHRVAGNRAAAFVDQRGFGDAIMALPDARFGLQLAPAATGWAPKPRYARAPDAVIKAA